MRVLVGLVALIVLAGAGFAAYRLAMPNGYAARTTAVPVTDEGDMLAVAPVKVDADRLARLLEAAPSVAKPGQSGPKLYVVGFRSCPTCLQFKAEQLDALLAAGVDVRHITYARRDREGKPRSKPGERAMVAELWLKPDFDLWTRWYAMEPQVFYDTQALPPSADDEGPRQAAVDAARQLVEDLSALLEPNEVALAMPALFWQDRESGQWMTYIGYSPDVFPKVRASLLGSPGT